MPMTYEATLRLKGKDSTASAFQSAARNAQSFYDTQSKGARQTEVDIQSVGRSFRSLRRTLMVGGATRILQDAIKAYADFDDRITRAGIDTGLTEGQVKRLSVASNQWARSWKLNVNDVLAGFEAWRKASGETAEQAVKDFPVILQAAKALRMDDNLAGFAKFTGLLQRQFKLNREEMALTLDMMVKSGVKGDELTKAFESHRQQVDKLGLSGAEGFKQWLTMVNAVYKQTGDWDQAVNIVGASLDAMTKKSKVGGDYVAKEMQRARTEGANMGEALVAVIQRWRYQFDNTEEGQKRFYKWIENTWGRDVLKFYQGVVDKTIDLTGAQEELGNASGAAAAKASAENKKLGGSLAELKSKFDNLLKSVGGFALSLDKAFGGKSGSLINNTTREFVSLAKIIDHLSRGEVRKAIAEFNEMRRASEGGEPKKEVPVTTLGPAEGPALGTKRSGATGSWEPVAGARHHGGPVTGGRPYLVGERGPEIVVPRAGGTVVPYGRDPTAGAFAGTQSAVRPDEIQVTNISSRATKEQAAEIERALRPWLEKLAKGGIGGGPGGGGPGGGAGAAGGGGFAGGGGTTRGGGATGEWGGGGGAAPMPSGEAPGGGSVSGAEKAGTSAGQAAGGQMGPQQALAFAQQHLGADEICDKSKLQAFFKKQGIAINPATTAWCAAFVNANLKQAGIKGTGSLVATSFLNWGKGVQAKNVQAGDVLVQARGRRAGQTGGHVGFATGRTRMGKSGLEVEMLGGNQAGTASGKGGVSTQGRSAAGLSVRRAAEAQGVTGALARPAAPAGGGGAVAAPTGGGGGGAAPTFAGGGGSAGGAGASGSFAGGGPVKTGAGARQPINRASLYSNLVERFRNSKLNGYVPKDGAQFGITTGAPEEWARLGVALGYQESSLQANPRPEPGNKFGVTGTAGLYQFGPKDLQRRGLGSDPTNVNAQISAMIGEMEKSKKAGAIRGPGNTGAAAYFGSIRRPHETIRHLGKAKQAEAEARVAARQEGGPVASGRPYVVGEKGPELFVPKGGGNVVPNRGDWSAAIDRGAVAAARATREELAKPIPIKFEHMPGEVQFRRKSTRRDVDREVRDARLYSLFDTGAA